MGRAFKCQLTLTPGFWTEGLQRKPMRTQKDRWSKLLHLQYLKKKHYILQTYKQFSSGQVIALVSQLGKLTMRWFAKNGLCWSYLVNIPQMLTHQPLSFYVSLSLPFSLSFSLSLSLSLLYLGQNHHLCGSLFMIQFPLSEQEQGDCVSCRNSRSAFRGSRGHFWKFLFILSTGPMCKSLKTVIKAYIH